MSTQDNGGPAFPVSTVNGTSGHQDGANTWQFPGMTMRDYFAAKAMQAALHGASLPGLIERDPHTMEVVDALASASYVLADAMLKARK